MRILTLNLMLFGLLFCSGCTAIKSRLSQDSPLPSLVKKYAQTKSEDVEDVEGSETQSSLPEYQTPVKMLVVWKDTTRIKDNGVATRGFGGRLYLYNAAGEAVRARGDLVVYGFDDSVTQRQGSKADRKIEIRNHQLQKHYSESALGPSYSVWIGWDRVGSVDKSVTLVPFFRTEDGEIVQGGQAVNALHTPGKKANTLHKERISSLTQPRPSDRHVSQASYQQDMMPSQAAPANQAARTGLRTTTITLPRATQQRLQTSDFGIPGSKSSSPVISSADAASVPETRASRIEEARQNRKLQMKELNVFGMPGQL